MSINLLSVFIYFVFSFDTYYCVNIQFKTPEVIVSVNRSKVVLLFRPFSVCMSVVTTMPVSWSVCLLIIYSSSFLNDFSFIITLSFLNDFSFIITLVFPNDFSFIIICVVASTLWLFIYQTSRLVCQVI